MTIETKTKVNHIATQLYGLTHSKVNVVIFSDAPELWFQYYMGLYLEKPTIVVITAGEKERYADQLNNKLVNFVYVTDYTTGPENEDVATQIAAIVSTIPDKEEDKA